MYNDFAQDVNSGVEAPHNIEAEQALLGALLLNNETHERVADFLQPEHFYDPLHAEIYAAISRLIQSGKMASPITLKNFFENFEPINVNLTVPQYLGRLAARAPTTINAENYGRTVYDLALRRLLVTVGQDIVADAFDAPPETTAEDMIVAAEARLAATAQGETEENAASIGDAAASVMQTYNSAYMRDNRMSGIATGLIDLDDKLGGFQKSDLVILAGRPSMGKTALITNIAENAARSGYVDDDGVEQPGAVHFFSLEMSKEQLAGRIISKIAEVPNDHLRRGTATENQMRKAFKAEKELEELPIYIDATGGISISQLRARARRRHRKHGTALIIVDYLQLMTTQGFSSGNRVQEITAITTGLKAMAKELNVPVVALSQLSRNVESREDKRPQLSDLRESGSIEQDADVVMFVFREEYYLERSQPEVDDPKYLTWSNRLQACAGKAEVILGKQRHGPVGTVGLAFEGQFTRFSNLARPPVQYGGGS